MEILAACGSGSRVPGLGRQSFTAVLIQQMRKCLRTEKPISVRGLHIRLWDDKTAPGLTETPVYFDLSEEDQGSIILKPLRSPTPPGFARRKKPASSFVFLKVSLEDDPTGLQIANWLKGFPPSSVQDVDIEGLVLKARSLENLKDHQKLLPGSIFGKLSPAAQLEILHNVRGLSRVVTNTAALAVGDEANVEKSPQEWASNSNVAEKVVNDIQTGVANVCDSVEGGILLDPGIKLDVAIHDELALAVDAEQAISLRRHLLGESLISNDLELCRESIEFKPRERGTTMKTRFRYGIKAGNPVIVEGFQYNPSEGSSDESPNTMHQLKRTVAQLSHPKRTSSHVLHCVGYVQERHAKRIGIVFDMLQHFDTNKMPVSLYELYSTYKRVPLGLRIQLALALAVALEGLHRIGWVHKDLRSETFLFFPKKNAETAPGQGRGSGRGSESSPNIDFTKPYLFGFEFARPEDADTEWMTDYSTKNNAYRHPERWGKPRIKFFKAHDVYSLGIVFLEIVSWKSVLKFTSMQDDRLDPFKVKDDLLRVATDDLPHMVGQSFTSVIVECLKFEERVQGLDEFGIHQEFKAKILEPLRRTAVNV